MPKRILTPSEADSVTALSKIRKALYVMQSIDHPDVFRFGCIGGRHIDLFNTAVRRLGQNLHKDGEIWHYAIVCELPGMTPEEITALEITLKYRLVGHGAPPAHSRDGRKDKFSGGDSQNVLRIFKEVVG